MNARLGVLVVVLVLLMGCGREPVANTGNGRYGVSPGANILWLPEAELNAELDLYTTMGFGWVRLDIDWHSIEAEQGVYDWTVPDRVIAAARSRGLQVLGILAYSPSWAAVVPDDPHSEPADPDDYARFAAAAASRYAPSGVHAWEIWNEPNSSLFWEPRPDPAGYVRLLSAAAQAIREADPQATVVAGALSPASDAANGSQISPLTFTKALMAAGAGPWFDVLSVHPYTYPQLPGGQVWSEGFDLAALQAQVPGKALWITEFGAPTGTGESAVSEARQAEILTAALGRSPDEVQRVFLYGGRDRGTDVADREQNFGFVRPDFTDKASRGALQDLLRAPSPTLSPSSSTRAP